MSRHLCDGTLPPVDERINHFLSSWPQEHNAGSAMRNRAREDDYIQREAAGEAQWCFEQLLAILAKKEVPSAQRRRRAEEDWKGMRRNQNEDLTDSDSRFDAVFTRMRENSVLPPECDQLLKYMDCLEPAVSKHLELHCTVTNLDEARTEAAK